MKHNAILMSLVLFISTAVAQNAPQWKSIVPDYPFQFPRDHGAHLDYRTEWWYFTGNVKTESGREFGYQLTFFRQGIDPAQPPEGSSRLRPRHAIFAHFAVTDNQTGVFSNTERIRRLDRLMANVSQDSMNIFLEDWSLKSDEQNRMEIFAQDVEEQMRLSFTLHPKKPLVFQGINGFSKKGVDEGNASSYLSWTRLHTEGTLFLRGETFSVTGESWFDHEWGTSQLGEGVVGWDWFGLRLDDNRELMLYQLRDEQGNPTEHSAGTLVNADGSTRHLTREDFSLDPLSTWKSPKTGGIYPAGWILRIPVEGIEITVKPLIDDAELNTRESIGTAYWEGPVAITGHVTGRGYAELTGYADSLKKRF